MRHLLPIAVLLCGCGGFDNSPLTLGEVRGQLSMVTSSRAFIAVLGAPESKQQLDATGVFSLKALVPGPVELIAVGGEEWAARVAAQIDAAKVLDLGQVALYPAGEIEVFPEVPSHQQVLVPTLTIEGTPWQRLRLNQEGRLHVEGMPSGCWTVTVASTGLSPSSQEVCLNQGEHKRVDLALGAPDGKVGSEGCRVSGCEFGYACESDGACR